MRFWPPVFLLVIVLHPYLSFGQRVIDIEDRKKLPQEIFDSLKTFRIVLCGETHGTNESPEFIEGLTKLFLGQGQKVMLALEIPEVYQNYIDSFLLSGNFSLIQKMPFFNRRIQDGRSSIAMANLLKNLYGYKNLKILFFDPDAPYSSGQERDSLMAERITTALHNNPDSKFIALAGDIHMKLTKGYPTTFIKSLSDLPDLTPEFLAKVRAAGEYKPAGYFLNNNKALKAGGIIALDMKYETGTYWACTDTLQRCKENDLGFHNQQYENFSTKDNFVYIQPIYIDVMGYTGIWYSKYVSASKPLSTAPVKSK